MFATFCLCAIILALPMGRSWAHQSSLLGCYWYVKYNALYSNTRAITDIYNFKSTCKDCASPEQHFIISPSPLLFVFLLLIRSGDVSPNPDLGGGRTDVTQPEIHVYTAALVSLLAVKLFPVIAVTNGRMYDVPTQ